MDSVLFDLTPGGAYKLRFASREDTVPSLHLFFSSSDHLRHRFAVGAAEAAKRISRAAGFDSRSLGDQLRKKSRLALQTAKRPHRVGLAVGRRASRWLHETGEFRIYRLLSDAAQALDPAQVTFEVNAIEDLLQYAPVSVNQATKSEFLGEALRRLERGQTVFTHAENGRLLHYCWLVERTETAGSEFGHRYAFAEPAAVLWNGYTHPDARGQGLHQASIRVRTRYVAAQRLAPNIVTGVRSDNGPSRHNIEKLGFEYVGSAWLKRRFGRSERWLTGEFLKPRTD